MSTLSLTVTSALSPPKTISSTITYSTSTSDTQTSVVISRKDWSRQTTNAITITIYFGEASNVQSIPPQSGSSGSTTITSTLRVNRGTSTVSKSLIMEISEVDSGGTSTVLGSKSVSISVPALASYTVSYNANGHGTAPSNQIKYYGTNLTLRSAITATGYSFVRWNTKADNTGTGYAGGASYTANAALSLYAIWNHSVTYNANGGSGAPSTQSALATSAITLSSSTPTRTGYSFRNWNTKADGTGTTYNASGSLAASAASVTLYAQWNANTYTVAYNANGHGTAPSSQTKTYGVTLTLRSAITATGYDFVRWNTDSYNTGTGYSAGGSYTANAGATLFAIWTRTITYNANGGTGAPGSQTDLVSNIITLSSKVPSRDGYGFVEWNTKADGSGTQYHPSDSYGVDSPSITLYAQWKKQITSVTIRSAKAIRVANNTGEEEVDEGTFAYITIPYVVQGMAAGTVTMTMTVTADSGTAPTITREEYQATKAADTSLTGTFVARASVCSIDVRYTFNVTITAVNTTVTQTNVVTTQKIILPSAFFTMDVKAGGKGVHFGGSATANGFYVSMNSYFNNPVIANVSSSGHTVFIKNSHMNRDTTTALSDYNESGRFGFYDSNNNSIGYINGFVAAGSKIPSGIRILGWKKVDGTSTYNGLSLGVNNDGSAHVSLSANATGAAAAWRSAIGAVNIAGDTMTGDLTINKAAPSYLTKGTSSTRIGAAAVTANVYAGRIHFKDSNNDIAQYIESGRDTSNKTWTSFIHRRTKADGSSYINHGFYLYIANDETVSVGFPNTTSRDAWATGLNVVKKAGDTMTGNLSIQKSGAQLYCRSTDLDSAVGQTIPSSGETMFGGIMFTDKQGYNMGWFRQYKNSNDRTYTQMNVRRSVSGSDVTNHLTLGINADGTRSVSVSESATWRSALGVYSTTQCDNNFVAKAGDTMSGRLLLQYNSPWYAMTNNEVDLKKTNNGISATKSCGVTSYDKNGLGMGSVSWNAQTDGTVSLSISAQNRTTAGALAGTQMITMTVAKDGTGTYGLTNAAAFRSAISVYSTTQCNNNYVNVTGDTMSGTLTLSKSDATDFGVRVKNSVGDVYLDVGATGNHGIWSNTHSKWLLYANSSGSVFLNGYNLTYGIKAWTEIASTSGTTKKTFSTALTGHTDLMIVAWYSTTYLATAIIPTFSLGSTEYEFYLGGGRSGTSASSQAGRRACCKITSTYITPVKMNVDGSEVNGNWRVYLR